MISLEVKTNFVKISANVLPITILPLSFFSSSTLVNSSAKLVLRGIRLLISLILPSTSAIYGVSRPFLISLFVELNSSDFSLSLSGFSTDSSNSLFKTVRILSIAGLSLSGVISLKSD